jgi:hypothetical protein
LAGQQDVGAVFADAGWLDAMYGWRFIDVPEAISDWPTAVSLHVGYGPPSAAHSLFWFAEGGMGEPGSALDPPLTSPETDPRLFTIEGEVRFTRLTIERADGTEVPGQEFGEGGRAWWAGLHGRDQRLTSEAQQSQPQSPRWPSGVKFD